MPDFSLRRLLAGDPNKAKGVTLSQHKDLLTQLGQLSDNERIQAAVELALKSKTDLTALAGALMPQEHAAVLGQVDSKTELRLLEAGFTPAVAGGPAGMTSMMSPQVMAALTASPFPASIGDFVRRSGFDGRIQAVRQGRLAMTTEERPEMEAALQELDKAQLKDLRDALVFRPPHPDLKSIQKLPALKGAPTVDKILDIFAGVGFELSESALPFETIFRPGSPITVTRSSGGVESNWKIQARAPGGDIVAINTRGDVKAISRRKVLEQNSKLIPLHTAVRNLRSGGGLDAGWHVAEHRPDGMILLRKPGMSKPVTLQELLRDNPELIAPPKVTGIAQRMFAPGQRVNVTRSSGEVDSDWEIGGYLSDNERVFVANATHHKKPRAGKLLLENLHLLPLGVDLAVPRTIGYVEDGWQAFGHTDDGLVRMLNGRGEWKAIPAEELIKLNHDLLLRPSDDTEAPAGGKVIAKAGAGRSQSLRFQRLNRVEPNQLIHDGYVDGGRGQTITDDGKASSSREVLVVDRTRDTNLREMLATARSMQTLPEADRLAALAALVEQHFVAVSGNALKPDEVLGSNHQNQEVLLGDAAQKGGGGVCRHRALLFKVLGDEAGLKVALVRGYAKCTDGSYGGHAWNEVELTDQPKQMVDVMNPTRIQNRVVFPALRASGLSMGYMDAAGVKLYE